MVDDAEEACRVAQIERLQFKKEDDAIRLERIEVTIAVIEPAGAIEASDHERDWQAAAVG